MDRTKNQGAAARYEPSHSGTAVGWRLVTMSADGNAWRPHPIPGFHLLNTGPVRDLAYGGNTFVAVGADRVILQSDPLTPSAPAIVRQLRPRTVTAGGEATLTIEVGGSSPLTYEWYKDGILSCVSAGPEWRFDSTAPVNNGVYQVVATNPLGSVVSLPARLTVESDQPWLNVRLVAGAIQIEIFGSIGRVCRIEATESLNPAAPIWEPLTDVTITSVPFTWTDPNPSQRPSRHRFYRVLQGPPMP